MASSIWVPPASRSAPPKYRCTINNCDHWYTADEKRQWQLHVIEHSKQDNNNELQHIEENQKHPLIAPADPEKLHYFRTHKNPS